MAGENGVLTVAVVLSVETVLGRGPAPVTTHCQGESQLSARAPTLKFLTVTMEPVLKVKSLLIHMTLQSFSEKPVIISFYDFVSLYIFIF